MITMENQSSVWQGNKEKHTSENLFIKWIIRKFNRDVTELAQSCKLVTTILDVG